MKKKKHTPEQIISRLHKVEALTPEGATIADAAKQLGAGPKAGRSDS